MVKGKWKRRVMSMNALSWYGEELATKAIKLISPQMNQLHPARTLKTYTVHYFITGVYILHFPPSHGGSIYLKNGKTTRTPPKTRENCKKMYKWHDYLLLINETIVVNQQCFIEHIFWKIKSNSLKQTNFWKITQYTMYLMLAWFFSLIFVWGPDSKLGGLKFP